jgi:hypothetical protein
MADQIQIAWRILPLEIIKDRVDPEKSMVVANNILERGPRAHYTRVVLVEPGTTVIRIMTTPHQVAPSSSVDWTVTTIYMDPDTFIPTTAVSWESFWVPHSSDNYSWESFWVPDSSDTYSWYFVLTNLTQSPDAPFTNMDVKEADFYLRLLDVDSHATASSIHYPDSTLFDLLFSVLHIKYIPIPVHLYSHNLYYMDGNGRVYKQYPTGRTVIANRP